MTDPILPHTEQTEEAQLNPWLAEGEAKLHKESEGWRRLVDGWHKAISAGTSGRFTRDQVGAALREDITMHKYTRLDARDALAITPVCSLAPFKLQKYIPEAAAQARAQAWQRCLSEVADRLRQGPLFAVLRATATGENRGGCYWRVEKVFEQDGTICLRQYIPRADQPNFQTDMVGVSALLTDILSARRWWFARNPIMAQAIPESGRQKGRRPD